MCMYCTVHSLSCVMCFSPEHVLGRKKTKRRRRPLSSGESEDGEGEGGRLERRKRRRRLSQSNHHLDDGDEELYRLRMR